MTEAIRQAPPRYVIQSAANTLEVLLAFGRPPYKFTPSEMASTLGMDRNQAFRCLRTLFHVGFVHVDEEDRYLLTTLVDQLSSVTHQSPSLITVAQPYMDEVLQSTGETVNLFILDDIEVTCIDHRDGVKPVRLVSEVGRRFPLHAGACPKAVLAFVPHEVQQAVLQQLLNLPKFTPHTVNTPEALQTEIRLTQSRGYAISDLDVDEDARGVGAPIFAGNGTVIGAISVGGPASRMSSERLAELGEFITETALLISRHLGYNHAVSSPLP